MPCGTALALETCDMCICIALLALSTDRSYNDTSVAMTTLRTQLLIFKYSSLVSITKVLWKNDVILGFRKYDKMIWEILKCQKGSSKKAK